MPPIQRHRIAKHRASESPASRALAEALRMVAGGSPVEEAARLHGLPGSVVSEALLGAGMDAGIHAEAGKYVRQHRRLLPAQEREMVERIMGHLPESLGMTARLWSRDPVFEAIERFTGARLPQRTLSTYLERWGFAPNRPLKEAYRRQPMLLKQWMREEYPYIALQVKEEKGVLYWWGESMLEPRGPRGRSTGSDLRTAEIPHFARARMLFVVSNRGHLLWRVVDGAPSEASVIDTLERAMAMVGRKLFVILPDTDLFRSPVFVGWSYSNRHRIEFRFTPPLEDAGTSQRAVAGE